MRTFSQKRVGYMRMLSLVAVFVALALAGCQGVTAPYQYEQLNSSSATFDVRGYTIDSAETVRVEYFRWSDGSWNLLSSAKPLAPNHVTYLDTVFFHWRVGGVSVPTSGWTSQGGRKRARLRVRDTRGKQARATTAQSILNCVIPKLANATDWPEADIMNCSSGDFDIFAP